MTELTANYDDTWKKAIGEYFDSFLFFFYPDIHDSINWNKTPISLDKELEKITSSSETEKRHADKLYQVWLLDNQEVWLLIHVEVQSQYDKDFPLRMFIYNYRAFDLWAPRLIKFLVAFIDKMMTLPPREILILHDLTRLVGFEISYS